MSLSKTNNKDTILTLPNQVRDFMNKYFCLNINEKRISTPYFINKKLRILRAPLFTGKGDPYSIEKYVSQFLSNKILNKEQIKDWMISQGIGIDCSGFVYNILAHWMFLEGLSIKNYLPSVSFFNIRKFFSRKIKPQSSINAYELTQPPFAKLIEVKQITPGCLIRLQGGKHVLFVYEVIKNDKTVSIIKFAHSTRDIKPPGVHKGYIQLNKDQNLSKAEWVDLVNNDNVFKKSNESITYRGYKLKVNQNGIYKPNLPIFK